MDIIPQDTKSSVKISWFSFLEALYSLTPLQRFLAIFAVLAIIPGYWLVRVGTFQAYSFYYDKKLASPSPSFENPTPLVASEVKILPVSGGFVAYFELNNLNPSLSATKVGYTAEFYDKAGALVYEKPGQTWVLPGQKTMVVVPRFNIQYELSQGKIKVSSVKWQNRLDYPEVKLETPVPVVFEEGSGVRLEGQVLNLSPYNVGAVRVLLFVYNNQNTLLGVSERYEFSLKPGERRAYVVSFPDISYLSSFRVVSMADTNTADYANVGVVSGELQLNRSTAPK